MDGDKRKKKMFRAKIARQNLKSETSKRGEFTEVSSWGRRMETKKNYERNSKFSSASQSQRRGPDEKNGIFFVLAFHSFDPESAIRKTDYSYIV